MQVVLVNEWMRFYHNVTAVQLFELQKILTADRPAVYPPGQSKAQKALRGLEAALDVHAVRQGPHLLSGLAASCGQTIVISILLVAPRQAPGPVIVLAVAQEQQHIASRAATHKK